MPSISFLLVLVLCWLPVNSQSCGPTPLTTEQCCELRMKNANATKPICIITCPADLTNTTSVNKTIFCRPRAREFDESCSIFSQVNNSTPCVSCHPQCLGCKGSSNLDCIRCVNARHGDACVGTCPAYTTFNNDTKLCYAITTTYPSNTEFSPDNKQNIGLIVGLTVGLFVLLLVVLLTILFFRRRRSRMDLANERDPSTITISSVMREGKPEKSDGLDLYENVPRIRDMSDSIQERHDEMTRYARDPTIRLQELETKNTTTFENETAGLKAPHLQTTKKPITRETWMHDDAQEIYENREQLLLNEYGGAVPSVARAEDDQETYENFAADSDSQVPRVSCDSENIASRDVRVNITKPSPENRIVSPVSNEKIDKSELDEINDLPIAPKPPGFDDADELYGNMAIVREEAECDTIQEIYENVNK